MIFRVGIGICVSVLLFIIWVLMRAAGKADRELEELSRRKFFGEDGNSSEL